MSPIDHDLLIEFAEACADFDKASFAESEARTELGRRVAITEAARSRKLLASRALENAALEATK